MSQLVEGLVRSGQRHNLMCPNILMLERWEILRRESTTTAGIRVVILEESGVTPQTQISDLSFAPSQYVMQHTTVRKVIRWVSVMQES